jgi:hypothetical protein
MGYVTDRLSNFESMTAHGVLWGGDLALCGSRRVDLMNPTGTRRWYLRRAG